MPDVIDVFLCNRREGFISGSHLLVVEHLFGKKYLRAHAGPRALTGRFALQ
jgi:hypothetical protein